MDPATRLAGAVGPTIAIAAGRIEPKVAEAACRLRRAQRTPDRP